MRVRNAIVMTAALVAAAILPVTYALSGNPLKYVGTDMCKMCHKSKDNSGPSWDASKHAKAFETLSSEAAKKISPTAATDEKCVGCHTTGAGKENGYKAGADNAEKMKNVGCEMCHGAGSEYKAGGVMAKSADAFAAGLITPSVAVCVQCHNSKSPTFKSFVFQDAAAAIRHGKEDAMKKEAIKAAYVGNGKCNMCHKSRDNSAMVWEGSKHAKALEALATDEAKKFSADPVNDPFCLACHTTGLTDAGGYDPAAKEEDRSKLAGVQCEACHGAGQKYMPMAVMKVKADAEANGMIIPNESTCRKCHNALSPTNKEFKYEEALKAIAHKKN